MGQSIADVREVVLMVRDVVPLVLPGVTEAGLKLQLAPVGHRGKLLMLQRG